MIRLQQRWYAFSVAKATKFTAAMVMDDTADFDLYVYKLNETDGTLELVGGSAIVGAGTQELSMLKLDEGIYFIGIEAATGNGSFLIHMQELMTAKKSMIQQTWRVLM